MLFEQFKELDFIGPLEIIALWNQKFNGPKELIIVNETGNEVTSAKELTIKTDTSFEN
ncbi:hypothetical protein [Candidatus Coxiella mudrowiae]|uniref:hypothetical protein n=1 Tax=Candidatus Coxiella mudrowiae TaxID=2054173 RepID=UPI0012FE9F24|nr:hypothetical protein [Candidatus Coxiella mudrowiae]